MTERIRIEIVLSRSAFKHWHEIERYADKLARRIVRVFPNSDTVIAAEDAPCTTARSIARVTVRCGDRVEYALVEEVIDLCFALYDDGYWRDEPAAE